MRVRRGVDGEDRRAVMVAAVAGVPAACRKGGRGGIRLGQGGAALGTSSSGSLQSLIITSHGLLLAQATGCNRLTVNSDNPAAMCDFLCTSFERCFKDTSMVPHESTKTTWGPVCNSLFSETPDEF